MNIYNKFRDTFVSHGYNEVAPVKIYPPPDNSTFFTCATVSLFRQRLIQGGIINSEFVIQPCLRSQNLKNYLEPNSALEYMSYFKMMGTICSADAFKINPLINFFEKFPSLGDRLIVKTHKSLMCIPEFKSLERNFVTVENSHEIDFYNWRYGNDKLTGLGVTFSVLQQDGNYADIGNLVQLNLNDEPIAWEFGLGYETFKSRLQGINSPFKSSMYFLHFSRYFDFEMSLKVLDLLVSGNAMFLSGVNEESKKEFKILNKTLRTICFLLHSVGTSNELFLDLISVFKDHKYKVVLLTYFTNTQNLISKFQVEVSNARTIFSSSELNRKINEYSIRNTIPSELITSFI
jgi:hypothetical protein